MTIKVKQDGTGIKKCLNGIPGHASLSLGASAQNWTTTQKSLFRIWIYLDKIWNKTMEDSL